MPWGAMARRGPWQACFTGLDGFFVCFSAGDTQDADGAKHHLHLAKDIRRGQRNTIAIKYAENTIIIYDFLPTDIPKYSYLNCAPGVYKNIHRPRSFNFKHPIDRKNWCRKR